MPDVGVLNLTIKDNSEQAGQGLEALARALFAVKSAQQKFNLSKVGEQVTQLAKTIQEAKGAGTIIKNLGTMFNAINKFSQLKSFTIDSEKIRDTAQSMLKLADAQDRVRETSEKSAGVSDWRTSMMGISETAKSAATEVKKNTDTMNHQMDRLSEVGSGWATIIRTQLYSSSPGNIKDATENAMKHVESSVQSASGSVKSLNSEVQNLINMLDQKVNYKGLRDIADINAGVMRNNTNLAAEAAKAFDDKFFERLDRAKDAVDNVFYKLEHPKNTQDSWSSQAFDQAMGIKDQYEGIVNEQNSIFNSPGLLDYIELLDRTRQEMRNYEAEATRIENQIKYNGSTEEREKALEQMYRSYVSSAEKEQQYLAAISDIVSKENQFTEATQQATQSIEKQTESVKAAESAYRTYYASIEDAFNGVRHGKKIDNDLMSSWLHGNGTKNEQEYAYRSLAKDFGMTVDEVKQKIQELLAAEKEATSNTTGVIQSASATLPANMPETTKYKPWTGEDVENIVNTYSQIELLEMKYNDLLNTTAKEIEENRLSQAQIADKAIALQNLRDKIDELKKAEESATGSSKTLREALDELFSTSKKGSFSKLISQFTRIAKMRAMRYVIRSITKGFREGLENVYYYSQAVGTSFAPAMDSAASSLSQMKNSIGAALAPALQSLIPVINTVVNWFITAVNYVNQFFALLNGQKTWTRALPQTTKAFEKQEKAAKKTGAAIKDLLADWDELNIIQSNTSGAGAGAGTSTAEDYLKMFEEVDTFDSKVKDVVNFLKENFSTIKDIAIAVGAAMLAWKVAGAVYDVLKLIGTLKGGIIMSAIGFTLSTAAGADIAENGFTVSNVLKTIGGLVASALGGYWIGKAALGVLFGSSAGMVGAVAGLGLGLMFLINSVRTRTLEKAYGTIAEDAETVRKNVMSYFKPGIEAEVEVTKARIKSVSDAENEVTKALAALEKDYPIAVTLKTEDSKTQLSDDVKVLINATNSMIRIRKENIRVPIVLSGQYSDSDSLVKFSDDQWDKTSKYIEGIGEKLGKLISQGIVEGAEFEELQRRLSAVVRAVTYGQKSGEFTGKVSIAGANLRTNGYTKDTVKAYIDTFQSERKNLLADATAAAVSEKADLKALYAAVEERYKNHDATYQDLIRAAMAYKNFDVAKEAERYMKEWVGEGDNLFAQDLAEGLSIVMQNNKNFKRGRNRIRAHTKNNIFEYTDENYINNEIEEAMDAVWDALAEETGMDKGALKDILGLANINPMDLFDDTFIKEIRDGLFRNMTENGLTKSQREKFFEALGFNPDDYKDLETEYATKVSADMHDAIKEAVSNSASDRGLFMSTILGLEDKYGVEDTKRVLAEIYDSMHFREEDNTLKTLLEDYLDIKEKKDSLLGTSGEDIISNENRTVKVGEFWGKTTDYMSEKLKNAWDYYKEAQNWVLGDDATSEDIQQLFGELSNEPVELKLKPVLSDETDIKKLYGDIMTQINASGLGMSDKADYMHVLMDRYTENDLEALQFIKKQIEILEGTKEEIFKKVFNDDFLYPNGSIRNPNNYIASMGGPLGKRPDVGYPTDNPYFVYPNKVGATEGEDISGDVAKGTKEANKTSEELLRQTAGYLLQLLNKNWTVNVTPTAAWGQHNAKSNDKYTYITGVEMV